MSIAGIAWSVYSLRGRSMAAPLWSTTGSFVRTVPMAAIASALALPFVRAQRNGVVLALVIKRVCASAASSGRVSAKFFPLPAYTFGVLGVH